MQRCDMTEFDITKFYFTEIWDSKIVNSSTNQERIRKMKVQGLKKGEVYMSQLVKNYEGLQKSWRESARITSRGK